MEQINNFVISKIKSELKYLVERSSSLSKDAPWGWVYAGDLQEIINQIDNFKKEIKTKTGEDILKGLQ